MTRQCLLPIGFVVVLLAGWSFSVAPRPAEAAEIRALLDRAAAAETLGDHAGSIEALEAALEKVRLDAPLAVKPFLLVTQPARFYGDYTPRPNAVFQGGEPQQFYMEPKNLVYPRTAAGTYEPAFNVDLQILTAAGQVVVSQERFGSFRLPTKSGVQGYLSEPQSDAERRPARGVQSPVRRARRELEEDRNGDSADHAEVGEARRAAGRVRLDGARV